jgi:hypothetical protein
MIILELLGEKVEGFFADIALVLGIDKRMPRFLREVRQNLIILGI